MSQALSEHEVETLATAGAAAPTGGNAQPWRLVADGATIDLLLHEERSTSFIDVDRAGSILGLGSFIENVSLTANALGLQHTIELLGFSGLDAPLARIQLVGRAEPSRTRLADAIFDRATNRTASDGTIIEGTHLDVMRRAVQVAGAGYDLVHTSDEAAKDRLANAFAEADVIRTFNRQFHEQMLSELRWSTGAAAETLDGIDVDTLELASGDRKGLSMMRRPWFVSLLVSRARVRSITKAGLNPTSHLCAVTMPREATAERLLEAGRALQRAWLSATSAGLALQPWCILPMFVLRSERHPETLSPKENRTIMEIAGDVESALGVGEDQRAIFTFRLSRPSAAPSARALRRPWTSFTRFA